MSGVWLSIYKRICHFRFKMALFLYENEAALQKCVPLFYISAAFVIGLSKKKQQMSLHLKIIAILSKKKKILSFRPTIKWLNRKGKKVHIRVVLFPPLAKYKQQGIHKSVNVKLSYEENWWKKNSKNGFVNEGH